MSKRVNSPNWWNGIHRRFKIFREKSHAGSNPAFGIKTRGDILMKSVKIDKYEFVWKDFRVFIKFQDLLYTLLTIAELQSSWLV